MHTPSKQPPEVSIVLPCLNEVETLPACIRQIQRTLRRHRIRGEIIVADNRSSDGTGMVAKHMGVRVVRVPKRGYGYAIQDGAKRAAAPLIIIGDPDGSYDFSHIPQFLTALRKGYDVVIGNRFRRHIRSNAMSWPHRFGNQLLTSIGNLLFHTPFHDHHCGIRGFSKAALCRMQIRSAHFEFDPEMAIKATLLGMRAKEIPVILWPDKRTRHHSYIRIVRDGLQNLVMMLHCWHDRNCLRSAAC
ncbi:MAG: glycosyltransferase family 2 protein [Candidatus Peribacteraceae bacterium]|nr:glycosyltransferase family 2 protein [Candidatus Peribacteraceae bacterium]MDD5742002.1 glycosyltransferase family 2 protein [Candidatus Peribacteraceae bacterium]